MRSASAIFMSRTEAIVSTQIVTLHGCEERTEAQRGTKVRT